MTLTKTLADIEITEDTMNALPVGSKLTDTDGDTWTVTSPGLFGMNGHAQGTSAAGDVLEYAPLTLVSVGTVEEDSSLARLQASINAAHDALLAAQAEILLARLEAAATEDADVEDNEQQEEPLAEWERELLGLPGKDDEDVFATGNLFRMAIAPGSGLFDKWDGMIVRSASPAANTFTPISTRRDCPEATGPFHWAHSHSETTFEPITLLTDLPEDETLPIGTRLVVLEGEDDFLPAFEVLRLTKPFQFGNRYAYVEESGWFAARFGYLPAEVEEVEDNSIDAPLVAGTRVVLVYGGSMNAQPGSTATLRKDFDPEVDRYIDIKWDTPIWRESASGFGTNQVDGNYYPEDFGYLAPPFEVGDRVRIVTDGNDEDSAMDEREKEVPIQFFHDVLGKTATILAGPDMSSYAGKMLRVQVDNGPAYALYARDVQLERA